MPIMKYHPWSILNSIQDEINKAFGHGYSSLAEENESNAMSAWSPNVDIKEEDDHILVYIDLPGVDPKDIKISIENNSLTIQGERESEKKEEGEKFSRMERFSGSFFRKFNLPSNIDKNKIKAKGKNGVIELLIPKIEEDKTKLIEIDIEK